MGSHYMINEKVFESDSFKSFDRYIVRDLKFSSREKMRMFHSRSPDTVKTYIRVIKKYVKFCKKSKKGPYPVTERKIREFIDTLDLTKDRGIVPVLKSSFQFSQKVRGDPEISFTSTDLLIDGLLREIGANFYSKVIKPVEVKELDVRKFLLSCLYGKTFCAPYNEKMNEFRTGLRCLVSLFCLSRCGDYMELKKSNIVLEDNCVTINWGRRKNNQKGKRQTSIIPRIQNHPLCPYSAFKHWFKATGLKEDQFLNSKLNARGKAIGEKGISRATCYMDISKVCKRLKLPKITEKMCKALGTRYYFPSILIFI